MSKISSTLYKTAEESKNKKQEEKENSLSKNSVKECLICCSNECDCVLMPCGHAGLCNDCGLKLLETKKICHICRVTIEKVLKIKDGDNQIIIATEIGIE